MGLVFPFSQICALGDLALSEEQCAYACGKVYNFICLKAKCHASSILGNRPALLPDVPKFQPSIKELVTPLYFFLELLSFVCRNVFLLYMQYAY